MTDPLQTIVELQCSRNRSSRDAWQDFATHRDRIQQLLTVASQAVQHADANRLNLTVLGAGNCNDLHLSYLLGAFKGIQLIDLDRAAVEEAVHRQLSGVDHQGEIRIIAPIDFSGLNDILCTFSITHPSVRGLADASLQEEPSQLVLSSCVFSQLVEAARLLTEGRSVDLLAVIQQLRRRHLMEIISRLVPGGCGLLVSDFCSSVTWPELAQVPEHVFPAVAAQQIQQRNFFTGLNPLIFQQLLNTDPQFQSLVQNVKLHLPWKWQLGGKWFSVFALQFSRRWDQAASSA